MPDSTSNDNTGRPRDRGARSMKQYLRDTAHDTWSEIRWRLGEDRRALEDIAGLLANPADDDPLALIRELEEHLGVDHYDWSARGEWVAQSNGD